MSESNETNAVQVPAWVCTALGTMLLILADSAWLKRTLACILVAMRGGGGLPLTPRPAWCCTRNLCA